MQLILIRHGETLWNKEKKVQGLTDIALSDIGIMQAKRLALSLKDHPVETIYASPLKRACQTAEIINDYHRKEIMIHRELVEMDMGDFEGLSYQELMTRGSDFLKRWMTNPAELKMPNGESLEELQDRAWSVMEKIIAKAENALIVSHNFTIASILCRLRNISLSEFRSACVGTASKTIIHFADGEAAIDILNDRSHLQG